MSDEIARMTKLREDIDAVRADLIAMCEPSRELSLALTKLDEARMWGQEAIAVRAVQLAQNVQVSYRNGAQS